MEEEHCLSLLGLLYCLLLLLKKNPQALNLSACAQPWQRWHCRQALHWGRPQGLWSGHLREASLETLNCGQRGLDGAEGRRCRR